jgi:hypothetical protein
MAISAYGFTTSGVAAGSAAAAAHASIGVVGSGSTFAFLQSLGATGLGLLGAAAIPLSATVGVTALSYCIYN